MAQPLHPSLPFRGGAILSPPILASSGLYQDVTDYKAVNPNVDLRQYKGQSLLVPIISQDHTSSCTANAGCYVRAALAAKYHIDARESPDLGDVLSRRYAYYWIRHIDGDPTVDAGATMQAACQVYRDYGVPPERYDPWNTAAATQDSLAWLNAKPSADATAAAQDYGVSGFARLSGSGGSLLASILTSLNAGLPPLLAFSVYLSFEQTGRDGRVVMPRSGETVLGGHAVACVGSYADQSFPGQGALVIANSWSDQWADYGICYMPWQYVLSGIVSEAWQLF